MASLIMTPYVLGGYSARLIGGHSALVGGGGLAHWLIRLFIWHAIWRVLLALWRVPTFGPVIVIVLGLVLVALAILSSRGGLRWPRRRQRGSDWGSTGSGPRDW